MDKLNDGEWLLSMASWVIQDGNYPDFAVGERRRFALEFFDRDLRETDPAVRSAVPRGRGWYDVTAEVEYGAEDLVVLDFGLLAYSDARARAPTPGTWRSGGVLLEVDCYSYFEIHAKRQGMPPAVYAWTITGILLDVDHHRVDDTVSLARGGLD